MSSPFKFLKSFTFKDRDHFFGREKETKILYKLVHQSSLILLYGKSGTGKTSLIQCGLASQFDGPDWLPIHIRREQNINVSLHKALDKYFPEKSNQETENLSLIIKMNNLYKKTLRPIYLIFDQLEELLILGDEEEQKEFFTSIKNIYDAGLSGCIILVTREEFFGHLHEFDELLPELFSFRLRLKPLNREHVQKIISGSFGKFNIKLQESDTDLLKQMVDVVTKEKISAQLAYLQVYMDSLYTQSYKRAYGDIERKEGELPEVIISKKDIDNEGGLREIFSHYIQNQELAIQERLLDKHSNLPEDTVSEILNTFVTEDGTKFPVYFTRADSVIAPEAKFFERLTLEKIPPMAVSDCILELEDRRILVLSDNIVELTHDSLAASIFENSSQEKRELNKIARRIKNNYKVYINSNKTSFLTETLLSEYDKYIPSLKSSKKIIKEVEKFINASEENVQKNKEKEKRNKVLRRLFLYTVIAFLLGMGAAVYDKNQRNKTEINNITNSLITSYRHKLSGGYKNALDELENTKKSIDRVKGNFLINNDTLQVIESIIKKMEKNYTLIQNKISNGDSLFQQEKSDLADTIQIEILKLYQEALAIKILPFIQKVTHEKDNKDRYINLKVKNLQDQMVFNVKKWMAKARTYSTYSKPWNMLAAEESIEYAEKLAISLDSSGFIFLDKIDKIKKEIKNKKNEQ